MSRRSRGRLRSVADAGTASSVAVRGNGSGDGAGSEGGGVVLRGNSTARQRSLGRPTPRTTSQATRPFNFNNSSAAVIRPDRTLRLKWSLIAVLVIPAIRINQRKLDGSRYVHINLDR